MVIFIKQIINGLQLGSIYALVALGYTMVYGIAKLINFAHGDIIMVGAYFALFLLSFIASKSWIVIVAVILLSFLFCAVVGMVIERVAYRPLRKSSRMSILITAIGVSFLLENLYLLLFSSTPKPFPNKFSNASVAIGGINISLLSMFTIIVTVAIMIALYLIINLSKIGKAMRAVSQDTGAAQLMGINIDTTISITFFIGSGLAAVASVMYSSTYPLIDPYMGSMLGIKAFIAAVLGGIGVIPGAMLGGIIMGITESLVKGYISSSMADAFVFIILILVLLVKPSGILGRNVKEKV